jgi:hypothetical protein
MPAEEFALREASQQVQQETDGGVQHQHGDDMRTSMPGMDDGMNRAGVYLMNQASGTGTNPQSTTIPMWMKSAGTWHLMLHSSLSLNEIQQTGPRGGDKFFATSWFMGMASRNLGEGSFMLRSMLSLDPLTVTKRRYPELFQTGETAFGSPVIDGQHPHDLFMEFGVQYARALSERTMFQIYLAPIGDPALGPVAFPHRISAEGLPQATLGHHLQDSTHIAGEVITTGVEYGPVRLEASGFHGTEPDENRWNIDAGAVNSWSSRLVISPSPIWSGQVSVGRLRKPEALEPGDIVRATASITHHQPQASGYWANSLIWGRNHKTATQRNINSYLLESTLRFKRENLVTGRVELVDKDELFDHGEVHEHDESGAESTEPLAGSIFRIGAYTMGYTRMIALIPGVEAGFGGNITMYSMPSSLEPFYGSCPVSILVHFRMMLGQR